MFARCLFVWTFWALALPVAANEPLAGRWLLTMKAGFEYDATLSAVEPTLYRLDCGATLLKGIYELRGDRLTMVQPSDPKLVGLVWQITNKNQLTLVEHPEKSQFGADYRGSTLGRQKTVGNAPKAKAAK